MKQCLVALADSVQYDLNNNQLILETNVQQPELVSNIGTQIFKPKTQSYVIASPANVNFIIEMAYKALNLGGFRGLSTIYKALAKMYIGITCAQVCKLLPQPIG